MSYGGDANGVTWGYASIDDWFASIVESFPAPWSIGDDTRYGTQLVDARGKVVATIWLPFGNPSARAKGAMSDEEWQDYCSDSHWESETQWHLANAAVAARNSITGHFRSESARSVVSTVLFKFGRWGTDVDSEIACGGPMRRRTSTEFDQQNKQNSGARSK